MTDRRFPFVLPLLLAGCLSSAAPLPPVRWFDPLPPAVADDAARPNAALRVTAAGHLGREFAVRTAPREIVFDERHGWIDAPAALVLAALAPRFAPGADAVPVTVEVEAFELDVQAAPRAVVRLAVRCRAVRATVEASAEAAAATPAAFADAMATALGRAADDVVARVGDR